MRTIGFIRNGEVVSADAIKPTDVFHMHDVDEAHLAIHYFSREFYCAMKGLPYRAEEDDA